MTVTPQSKTVGPREVEPLNAPVLKGPHAKHSETKRWMRTAEAAVRINHTPSALVNWRMRGVGPAHHKCNRVVLYDVADLDRWVEAQRVEPKPVKLSAASEQKAA